MTCLLNINNLTRAHEPIIGHFILEEGEEESTDQWGGARRTKVENVTGQLDLIVS